MIDTELLKRWGELTTDANPLHTDPEYAASTRFGVPIAHGHLLACLAIESLDADAVSVRFVAPVPVGSEIEVRPDGIHVGGAHCVEITPIADPTMLFDHDSIVRYAAASADDNPIHLDEEAARTAGLDGAIAQGMLVLGWASGQVHIPDGAYTLTARFIAPVPVGEVGTLHIDGDGSARVTRDDGRDAVSLQYSAEVDADRLRLPEGVQLVAEVAVAPTNATLTALKEAVGARFAAPTYPFMLTAVGFVPDDDANDGIRRPYPVRDCADWVASDRPALHGEQTITVARAFTLGERLIARTAVISRHRRERSRGALVFTAIRTVFADASGAVIAASEMNLIVVEDD